MESSRPHLFIEILHILVQETGNIALLSFKNRSLAKDLLITV